MRAHLPYIFVADLFAYGCVHFEFDLDGLSSEINQHTVTVVIIQHTVLDTFVIGPALQHEIVPGESSILSIRKGFLQSDLVPGTSGAHTGIGRKHIVRSISTHAFFEQQPFGIGHSLGFLGFLVCDSFALAVPDAGEREQLVGDTVVLIHVVGKELYKVGVRAHNGVMIRRMQGDESGYDIIGFGLGMPYHRTIGAFAQILSELIVGFPEQPIFFGFGFCESLSSFGAIAFVGRVKILAP
jgi:hypothetical protein